MLRSKQVRYAITISLSFGVDMCFAYALARIFNAPLGVAAAAGFAVGLSVNYILFEFWAFRRARNSFSLMRGGLTALSASVALLTRLAVIYLLGAVMARGAFADGFRLIAGAGVSAIVNYLFVSRLVFRNRNALD